MDSTNNSVSDNGDLSSVVVDDFSEDPALEFIGDWTHLNKWNGAMNSTITYTTSNGSSVLFTFNGTAVGVAGRVAPLNNASPPMSLYSVDGALLGNYTAPINATAEDPDVSFFVTNSLSAGVHKLVINVTRTEGNAPYLLDYIAYLPPQETTSTSSAPSSSSSSPTASAGTPSSTHASKPVGAIVGGVIGGVALLLIIALAIWLVQRKRSRHQAHLYQSAIAADILHPETEGKAVGSIIPFIVPPPPSSPVPDPPAVPRLVQQPSPSISEPPISSQTAPPAAHANPPPTGSVYHQDSGIRFTPTGEPVHVLPEPSDIPDDVPPGYTEY
ncbi:hypothetical protein EIP86_001919 [Pleurotus ostreatoroseus]|nr:hypothetical protein EIP86_001919 [Pleurotus ostreatoroseus]